MLLKTLSSNPDVALPDNAHYIQRARNEVNIDVTGFVTQLRNNGSEARKACLIDGIYVRIKHSLIIGATPCEVSLTRALPMPREGIISHVYLPSTRYWTYNQAGWREVERADVVEALPEMQRLLLPPPAIAFPCIGGLNNFAETVPDATTKGVILLGDRYIRGLPEDPPSGRSVSLGADSSIRIQLPYKNCLSSCLE